MIYSFATEKERDAAAAGGTPTAAYGTASQAPQGIVGQGSGTPKGSVISEIQELVYMEKFCLKIGFNERQTATLISGKPLFYEGELYSEEHKRKFTTERAGFQVVKDPKDMSKLALAINGQVIGEWFKEQFNRLFSSVKKTVEPLRRGKGMRL